MMKKRKCFRCEEDINDENVYTYNDNLFCDEECVVSQLSDDDIVFQVYVDEDGNIDD